MTRYLYGCKLRKDDNFLDIQRMSKRRFYRSNQRKMDNGSRVVKFVQPTNRLVLKTFSSTLDNRKIYVSSANPLYLQPYTIVVNYFFPYDQDKFILLLFRTHTILSIHFSQNVCAQQSKSIEKNEANGVLIQVIECWKPNE